MYEHVDIPVNNNYVMTCLIFKIFRLSEENMMEVYLDDLGTIQTVSDTLPNYLGWVHNILQDSIMNSS